MEAEQTVQYCKTLQQVSHFLKCSEIECKILRLSKLTSIEVDVNSISGSDNVTETVFETTSKILQDNSIWFYCLSNTTFIYIRLHWKQRNCCVVLNSTFCFVLQRYNAALGSKYHPEYNNYNGYRKLGQPRKSLV